MTVVSSQDDTVVQQVVILERRTFAGYWEYLLENAIFTVPAVNAFAGAGLVNEKGELVGIGSLFLSEISSRLWSRAICLFQLKLCYQSWMI